jgi:hypothetical protein
VRSAARGGHEVLDALAGQHEADAVVVAHRGEPQDRAQLRRQLALLDRGRAEAHRARHVDDQHDRQLAFLDVALDVRRAEPGGDVPVDGADLVTGHVRADFLELDAPALEDALGLAGEQVLDEMSTPDLEPPDLGQEFRGLHQGTRTWSRMRRATSSPSTPSASAS